MMKVDSNTIPKPASDPPHRIVCQTDDSTDQTIRPGYHGVRDPEQRDQPKVNEHCDPRRHADAVVNSLGDQEAPHERDEVQKRQEEDGVTSHAVDKANDASHVLRPRSDE